jgi:hypothetical protein
LKLDLPWTKGKSSNPRPFCFYGNNLKSFCKIHAWPRTLI